MPSIYVLLFSLYWAQGLPVGFMTHALPVILRHEGLSLAHIGGFGLLMLPWSIKVLWAPVMDRVGQYRQWIIGLQLLMCVSLMILAYIPIDQLQHRHVLMIFFVVLFVMNMAAASQDIATDGLAVRSLNHQQQHWGNSVQVIGSRLGFIVGGGTLLWLIDVWQWHSVILGLALLVALNTLPILFQQQSSLHASQPKSRSRFDVKAYLCDLKIRPELWAWIGVLLSFKLVDGLSGAIIKALLVDVGLSLQQIGLYISGLGAVAALLGAALGGLLLKYYSRPRALCILSWLKLSTLLGYVGLAYALEQQYRMAPWLIYSLHALEDLLASMLLVVMLSLIMHYSRPAWAATDFTLQVSIMATLSGVLYVLSGIVADALGYIDYFMLLLGLGVLSLYPIYRWKKYYSA